MIKNINWAAIGAIAIVMSLLFYVLSIPQLQPQFTAQPVTLQTFALFAFAAFISVLLLVVAADRWIAGGKANIVIASLGIAFFFMIANLAMAQFGYGVLSVTNAFATFTTALLVSLAALAVLGGKHTKDVVTEH